MRSGSILLWDISARYRLRLNQNGSEQQQKQAEMALNQLINRYQVEHAGKPERQP
ncbi:hypothetical protein HQH52_07260 [Escherichia coli]|nr:hypothetical protein [Escherichia coli]MBF5334875.1 hypothetical protein [Escherichia coli]VEB54005.1 Uncharacterised protein [Escherichia coli]